jgi:hypothetical protein
MHILLFTTIIFLRPHLVRQIDLVRLSSQLRQPAIPGSPGELPFLNLVPCDEDMEFGVS